MAARADKNSQQYFVGRHLNWPDGAANRKSLRAVSRLKGLSAILGEGCDTVDGRGVEELTDLVGGPGV
jgi:hypothetical protein